jgi:uncharacterized protein with von Willebrand factor type A (vWA) domain
MKMTIDELKHQIAEILDEAKKKKEKVDKIKRMSAQIEAYGFYNEEHDFSQPLGSANLYRQQGAANWGPYTSAGTAVDHQNAGNPNAIRIKEEKALRTVVREVIQNGLIDEGSAWAPFIKRQEPIFESTWEEAAYRIDEAWYDDFKKDKKGKKDDDEKPKGKFEKTSYGHVKGHGSEKSSKK